MITVEGHCITECRGDSNARLPAPRALIFRPKLRNLHIDGFELQKLNNKKNLKTECHCGSNGRLPAPRALIFRPKLRNLHIDGFA